MDKKGTVNFHDEAFLDGLALSVNVLSRIINNSREHGIGLLRELSEITHLYNCERSEAIQLSAKDNQSTLTDAQFVAESIRGHWFIETSLHWVLDMAFRENEARHGAGKTASDMPVLRHFALSIIKQDKTWKVGVANSRKLAGWNLEYLVKLLMNSRGKN